MTMEVSSQDIQEIKASLKDLQTNVNLLLTTKAVQEQEHQWIRDHQEILHGVGKEPGLIAQVDRHERWIIARDKVMWILLSVFITEIGIGIIILARNGVGM